MLKLRINDSPGIVTLSDPVNTDWIVWGVDGSTPAAARKTDANLISDITPVGGATIGADPYSYIQYTWTGGAPVASETNATPEATVSGSANIGFQITIPASTSVQTLNIYTGVHGGAELDASISDGSSPSIADTTVTSLGEADKTYSIDFRAASPGQTLTIQLKLTDPNGYLDLQAATLQPHLPEVALTSPVDRQTFSSGANIPTSVNVNQYDNAISSVAINSNGVQLLDMITPPYSATWSGAAPGHYQLQSTATDSDQLTGMSQALAIDVVGNGGTLTESLGTFTGTVDLTSEGNADWRMFALFDEAEADVKAGVPTLISDYTVLGNHGSFAENPCGGPDSFSFEDGTPDTTESGISPCAYVDGLNNGFQFTVTADATPRTLRVYLGADYGVVKLHAFLSDGSAPPVVDASLNTQDAATDTVYTINFSSASAGQTLTVQFTLEQQYDWGDLDLYAATLNGSAYAEAPTIASVSPGSGAPGTLVTIRGTNFGTTQGASVVTLNGMPATPASWSSTKITFTVPGTATSGNVGVTVAGIQTSGSNFTVLPAPTITSLSQTVGAVGMPITITGTNFGSFQGAGTVKFNGATGTPTHWSATSIVVPVPTGASSGNVVVHSSGVDTNGLNFTVVTVTAIGITPQNLTLPLNSVQRFVATATYSNGGTQDISSFSSWSSSDTTIATIDATGSLINLAQGQTTIQAVFEGVAASTTVTFSGQSFVPVGDLNNSRWGHTATLLQNGQVLIVGGESQNSTLQTAEIYDPVTKTFSGTGSLNVPRLFHVATLLPDGTVLVVGGEHDLGDIGSVNSLGAEIYDPSTGSFTLIAPDVTFAVSSATLLSSGKVLLMEIPQNQIYDPASQTFTNNSADTYPTNSDGETVTAFDDGTALIAGGGGFSGFLANAEIYNSANGVYTAVSNLLVPRAFHTATLLKSGKVLIAGGLSLVTTESYDRTAKTFSPNASMALARQQPTANLLGNGSVLIVGGDSNSQGTTTAELYNPVGQGFTGAGALIFPRGGSTSTLLNDGTVLIAGGVTVNGFVPTAEIYGTPPPPPISLMINPASATLHLGQTQRFTVTDQTGLQRFDATWTVSDTTLATLSADSSPILTPIAYGLVTLTATIGNVSTQAQVIISPSFLQITPSSVNMQVGDARQFSVVDNLGRPLAGASWSVSDSTLASITTDDQPTLTALNPGTVIVTANIEGVTGQAQVTISPIGVLLPGSVLWSNPPVAGFSPIQIAQATPTESAPDLYSIQNSADGTQSVIQALTADGQQMWQTTLPILNGNSVPDGSGGLIVTENNTCFPNQANPMTIARVDAAGNVEPVISAAGVIGGGGVVYCYPDTIKAMEPQIAVRGDGAFIIDAMTNSGLPPLTIVGGPNGVDQIFIPWSTSTNPFGTQFNDFSPMGPPMVNSDGNTYLEYEVRDIAYPPKITSAVLYLLQIAPDNSTTTMTLSSTTDDENLMPGRIIPDGNGGVLATWTVSPSNPPQWSPANPPYPYQASDVVNGVPGAPYNLPFTPSSTTAGDYPELVLGENGVAFASGSSTTLDGTNTNVQQIASFNIANGSPNWNYQTPAPDSLSIVAATAGNGMVSKATDQSGNDTVLRSDSSGSTASDTWSQSGFAHVDFMAADSFVANPINAGGTELVSSGVLVDLPNSTLPIPKPNHAAQRKINVQVFQLDTTQNGVLPITIDMTQRVNSAIQYWQNQGILLNWDQTKGSKGIQISPTCANPGCELSDYDNLEDIANDPTIAWMKAGFFLQEFPNTKSIYYVFINNVAGDETAAGTLGIPINPIGTSSGPSNIVAAGRSVDDVLPHETGHVFGLQHVRSAGNLMCGTIGNNWFFDLWPKLTCSSWWSTSLNASQVVTAKKNAKKYLP
jgi:hypothetical protein